MPAAKLLFAGTPDFAVPSLRALIRCGADIHAVLTQPDRPAGRGRKLTASPVKQCAVEAGIPVWQPETLKDAAIQAQIAAAGPDLFVVAAYGLLLPQAVLDMPQRACVNVHASLLPRWRGASPIQAAILAGDAETGISLMQMEAGLDTGPVYARSATPIDVGDTAGVLHDRLAGMGGELLAMNLDALLAGALEAEPQDGTLATYAPKIGRADARLDWQQPAAAILRAIRAYNPVPGAFFETGGERVKCWAADAAEGAGTPGHVLKDEGAGVVVACGEGAIRLAEVQRPGRGRISGAEFAGQRQLDGEVFE